MQFVEAAFRGSGAKLYLPDPEQPDHDLRPQFDQTTVTIEGKQREMLTSALGMMLAFNNDLSGRAQLMHDCHVFALACQTGDNQRGVSYDLERGGSKIDVSERLFQYGADEPLTDPGDIVGIYDASPEDDLAFRLASRHLMVRASTDDEKAIYLSKPGIRAAVVAHTYDEIRKLYDYEDPSVAIIGKLERVKP